MPRLPLAQAVAVRNAEIFLQHGLVGVGSDPVLDLVEAQAQRMVEEGGERQTRKRYAVWGDVPH